VNISPCGIVSNDAMESILAALIILSPFSRVVRISPESSITNFDITHHLFIIKKITEDFDPAEKLIIFEQYGNVIPEILHGHHVLANPLVVATHAIIHPCYPPSPV
jgi:hypothetical protein